MNYRDAALGASEWLLTQAVDTGDGLGWPENPDEDVDHSLYGSAGIVLTMLDAYEATFDERFLTAAVRGNDLLVARAATGSSTWDGFYVGLAGVGFVQAELARITGDGAPVRATVAALRRRATIDGDTAHWSTMTDIIGGAAGTICWLAQIGEDDLAEAAARWLISVGEAAAGGVRWSFDVKNIDYMPNFSHGTAGNAYALASAGFVDEAIAGANHLLALAERPDGGFRVRHFDDAEPADFPLGWCHGPTGTARLFQLLADETGDSQWLDLRDACARTVRTSGIPVRREPGFWDNVAACCGSTGVASFFLGLHRRTADLDHLGFARTMADDIVSHATVDAAGVRWSNIEHRNPDPVLPAGLGYMQGAAGIASFLFELDRFVDGDGSYRRWPDNPF